jgi:UDP-glucuronate 4-epimerase
VKILITGAAGFIGFHLAETLAARDYTLVGLDNINDYYEVDLKYRRLEYSGFEKEFIKDGVKVPSGKHKNYSFVKLDLKDRDALFSLFQDEQFDYVCNLAAQAGVRYSLENPYAYVDSNIQGFLNILEACRHHRIKHLVFASSSSVYGLNEKVPFSVEDTADHPASLYAATKKSNELMAHSYSYLFGLPVTGLRFFTVYGPWGRPDMAPFIFTRAILEGKPISLFNYGDMKRDFTYVDDIVEAMSRVLTLVPQGSPQWDGKAPSPASSSAPYKIYNIGSGRPVDLRKFIETLEHCLGQKAEKQLLPMQSGDIPVTWADTSGLESAIGCSPQTDIETGVAKLVDWYKKFYSKGNPTL